MSTQLADLDAGHVSEEVFAYSLRCYRKPEAMATACEDYRAAATIDLVLNAHDKDAPIAIEPKLCQVSERSEPFCQAFV